MCEFVSTIHEIKIYTFGGDGAYSNIDSWFYCI